MLLTTTSTSLSLTWSSPETQNGLITQYSIQAIPETQVDGHTGTKSIYSYATLLS